MISIERCRAILGSGYTNKQIEQIRNQLTELANLLIDEYTPGRIDTNEGDHLLQGFNKRTGHARLQPGSARNRM